MRINVIENFWVTSATYGYTVSREKEEPKKVVDKEGVVTYVPVLIGRESYYSKLDHCLEDIFERMVSKSEAKDLKSLLKEIKEIKKYLKEFSFEVNADET